MLKIMSNVPIIKKVPLIPEKFRRQDRWVFAGIVLVACAVFIFIILPLYSVIRESYTVEKMISLRRYVNLLVEPRILQVLGNSLWLAISAGIVSTLMGFAYAYLLSRPNTRGRGFFESMALLPIITPPFSISIATILLFGRAGLISSSLLGLRTNIFYGYYGLLLVQSLSYAPIAYLVIVGMLRGINPALEEAAINMGASRLKVFATITWPLIRPALANAFLLAFITSLADFGNPMVIGGDYGVLATSIYFYVVGRYDFGSAAALSVILLVPSLGAFFIQKYWVGRKNYVTITGKPSTYGASTCLPILRLCRIVSLIWSGLIILLYASILVGGFTKVWGVDYSFSLSNYNFIFQIGMGPLWNTLWLALISTPLAAVFGLIVAYLTTRKKFTGRSTLEFSTMLSFAVPGTVIGIGYVLSFNSGPIVLTGTATIIVLALVFRNMPVAIRSGVASLQQIDNSLEEAAANMGANSGRVFWEIVLPLVKSSVLAGMIFSFVRAMTAISSVIFLISPKWPLVVPAILSMMDGGRSGAASAYSSIMIVIIIALIMVMNRVIGGRSVVNSIEL